MAATRATSDGDMMPMPPPCFRDAADALYIHCYARRQISCRADVGRQRRMNTCRL